MKIKTAKIKDSILKILQNTHPGSVNAITRHDIYNRMRGYSENDITKQLNILERGRYIRYWDKGNNAWIYAIDEQGLEKLADGGFIGDKYKGLMNAFVWPVITGFISSIFALMLWFLFQK